MTTEQLQMILNAMQGLGLEGKQAFIWWLVLDKALPVFGWLATFGMGVWGVLRVVSKFSDSVALVDSICLELNAGRFDKVSAANADKLLGRVRQLAEAAKGRKDAV